MGRENRPELRDGHRRGLTLLAEAAGVGAEASALPEPRFAAGTPLRAAVDRLARETGADPAGLRSDATFAWAVETVAANCGGDCRDLLLSGRLTRKEVASLARTHPDRQRHEVAALAAGRPLFAKPADGPPPFDTLGWHEVVSRLRRAAGIVRAAEAATGRDGATEGGPAGLGERLRRCRAETAALLAHLSDLGGDEGAGHDGSAEDRPAGGRTAGAGAAGLIAQATGFVKKNARDLPRLVRESGVDRDAAAEAARLARSILRSTDRMLGDSREA